MRRTLGPAAPLALVAALFVLAFAASPAKAEFGIAPGTWQALTCEMNSDVPAAPAPPPLPQAMGQCTDGTPGQWFTQAAGHPDWGITNFFLNTTGGFPDGFLREIVVDTPEGLGVNPEATPKCPIPAGPVLGCAPNTQVGTNYLTVVAATSPTLLQTRVALPVYNMEPFDGVPSMVAFQTMEGPTYIVGSLDPVDQHVIFTISDIHPPSMTNPPIVGSRLVFDGQSGNGTYLTMPSNCAGGQTSELHVEEQVPPGGSDSASFTTAVGADGCDQVPFDPAIDVTVNSETDSPEPVTLDVQLPFDPNEPIANSHLLTAQVQLPEGAGLNPSVANGLEVCTDAQFKKGTDDPIECPAASQIGSVEVQTPSLPPDSLDGAVYVGAPTSNDPTSGNQFRIFIHVVSERYGVNVRLIGNVFPNLDTGQLTAVVDDNPQAPFTSFQVHIDGGPRGALTSPDTCGPHTTNTVMTPWSGGADETPSSSFNLTNAPGGGPCAETLADRPFAPGYDAQVLNSTAGAFSPFFLQMTRPDGAQEIKEVDIKLPPGVVAKLAGVPYCSEAAIEAARGRSGVDEQNSPSCPAASHVGEVGIDAGSGPAPFHADGDVYLAGPYKGAPVSMAFVTPAVAGPYDLGTVVVRTALHIDPATARVNAVSDRIPNVFGGVKLGIRQIDVNINRQDFTTNATTCRREFNSGGLIYGGGANPLNPAAGVGFPVSSRYRAVDCRDLQFRPRFFTRLFTSGKRGTRRSFNPPFRAILDARNGDANLHRAALILPNSTILDQSHIRTVCTRAQLASRNCPKGSVYGSAVATSPLLGGRLRGGVFLVSSDNVLPDLLVDLQGQVPIQLRGVISATRGRLKTVFFPTPDVAVDKFILNMKGGNRGLLVNTRNLCARPNLAFLNLRAQNSRRVRTNRQLLNVPACRRG